ncbi:hypothetical protein TrCOL_g3997 [Triparma columacea]|uniref:Nephrocystin 3-like N-terminal domain-containing protein n=1 Tax=Triparma columacea TaxID=722753 RepID=A0A9W7LG28_9STRA|nr:hypothetical protein TrCOL_g3997 [Triparma columacea]
MNTRLCSADQLSNKSNTTCSLHLHFSFRSSPGTSTGQTDTDMPREAIARLHPQQDFLYGVGKTVGYLDKKRGKRDGENLGGLNKYRFHGRKWLFEDVRKWMEDENGEQTMVLLASAGFGKSAFAAQLVEEEMKDDVVAFHFCSNEEIDNLNPRKFIDGLVVSFAKNVEGFTVKLLELVKLQMENGEKGEPLFDQGSLDLFNKFVDDKKKEPQSIIRHYLLGALQDVENPKDGKTKLIVIDSLDEANLYPKGEKEKNILDLVAEMAESDTFPKWLKLLVTSRDQISVTDKLASAEKVDLKMKLEGEHKNNNEEDMRLYLEDRLGFDVLLPDRYQMQQAMGVVNANNWANVDKLKEFVEAIVETSEGMFLYAVYVAKDVEEGHISLDQNVEEFKKDLPKGIYAFYKKRFIEMFETDMNYYRTNVMPVLAVIAAAREPIPLDVLEKASGLEDGAEYEVLEKITAFCKDRGDGGNETFAFVHQSFTDWLLNEHEMESKKRIDNKKFMVSKESGEEAIAKVLLKRGWNSESEYFSRQGSHYLRDVVREWRLDKDEAEKKYGEIENWDVTEVTSFRKLFSGAKEFNSNLSLWNTSNCTNMQSMFNGCYAFNSDISLWNTLNCTKMNGMFKGCSAFNSDISSWNTSKCTNMSSMFKGCSAFNYDLSTWNTSKCTDTGWMFCGCSAFNSDLSTWNTSNCTIMSSMFEDCSAFNSDLSLWNTSKCTNMSRMFKGCSAFNSDISKWKTSKCTNMSSMFHSCSAFNSDLSTWDTSKCTSMSYMFQNATSFDSDLSQWDMSKDKKKGSMFTNATAMKASHKPKDVKKGGKGGKGRCKTK